GFYRLPFETGVGVQAVTGMSVVGTQITITMSQAQIDLLDQAYSALKESVYDALLPQTRLKPYLDQIRERVGEAANDEVFEMRRMG
ncbi:MAG: hypothetical protein Q7U78_13565, partial [Gallionella sp.]|nr:hypothetical protein [Gallionella sp.]